jgi:hypothetical protein
MVIGEKIMTKFILMTQTPLAVTCLIFHQSTVRNDYINGSIALQVCRRVVESDGTSQAWDGQTPIKREPQSK